MTVGTDSHAHVTFPLAPQQFLGRFVRRQGQYGIVSVVARVGELGVELIEEPERIFPRDGTIEIQGIASRNEPHPGDWLEFDVVRNTRRRAPEFKATRFRRLPRYAELPNAALSTYRALFTHEGWSANRRPGMWALRISTDMVIVVVLEPRKDSALRISKAAARDVRWYHFDANAVVSLPADSSTESLFLVESTRLGGSFDWSDEGDHVARVVRNLSSTHDRQVDELLAWLDLHYEETTGRILDFTSDRKAAEAALLSGELAERIRADRALMRAYLDAALADERVRTAIAEFVQDANSEERRKLRQELDLTIAEERQRQLSELSENISRRRAEVESQLNDELTEKAKAFDKEIEARRTVKETTLAERIKVLERDFSARKSVLQEEIVAKEAQLNPLNAAVRAAEEELALVSEMVSAERSRLHDTVTEIDRLLTVGQKLNSAGTPSQAVTTGARLLSEGVGWTFSERGSMNAQGKGKLLGQQTLLTANGKDLVRKLTVLLLSGELPVVFGDDAADLLRFTEAFLTPGRIAIIEADPTLISIDDLWARPGSGAPTSMASAAHAARSGQSVLVVIKEIERSGARFWVPAMAEAFRNGNLPRGLLVCCTANDIKHEELAALPNRWPTLEVNDAFVPGAYLLAPDLLAPPHLDQLIIDTGTAPEDLSGSAQILLELGFELNVAQAMRIARMFAEAKRLLGNEADAKRIVADIALSIETKAD